MILKIICLTMEAITVRPFREVHGYRGETPPKQMKEHCDTIYVLVKKSVISASYCDIDYKGRVSKYDEVILEFVIQ